tara:strand:- start:150 stop:602 length:453 start_codon:yes stop_codon:yes gene_type:complete
MIKLKDLLLETPSTRAMRDSKKGASKQFLKDFDKAFKKRSKELGYGKLKKIVKTYDIQTSPPRDFGQPIDREKRKGIEVDYQVGDSVVPGRKLYKYPLEAFIKDMKRGFSGYKIEKSGPTHFYLMKGGNTYHLAYTPAMNGAFVMGSSRL